MLLRGQRRLVKKDYKKTYKVAALFPVAGLALGLGAALLRELACRPRFSGPASRFNRAYVWPVSASCRRSKHTKRRRRPKHAQSGAAPRTLGRGDRGISWTVVDYPLSRFSEGVRSIKLAIDMDKIEAGQGDRLHFRNC